MLSTCWQCSSKYVDQCVGQHVHRQKSLSVRMCLCLCVGGCCDNSIAVLVPKRGAEVVKRGTLSLRQ